MTAQDHSVTVEDIWHGLEDVYKKGVVRAIGVSNWNGEQIERTLKTATVPIHNCQSTFAHKRASKSIIFTFKYSTDFRRNAEWEPAPNAMEDPQVKRLAFKYTKTPAQILLRYLIDRNIAVIPKSITPSRIVENFKLFDFTLTNEEIKLLESSKHRQRLFLNDFMEGHPEDPFAAERQR
nr:Aldo keto reductase domain containing protein [Haemonchus contortus]